MKKTEALEGNMRPRRSFHEELSRGFQTLAPPVDVLILKVRRISGDMVRYKVDEKWVRMIRPPKECCSPWPRDRTGPPAKGKIEALRNTTTGSGSTKVSRQLIDLKPTEGPNQF
jgi:hypothetical protein